MVLGPVVTLASRSPCFGCGAPGAVLCRGCREGLAPPHRSDSIESVDRVVIPWAYEAGARDLVLALKLRARKAAADVLGAAVASELQSCGTLAEAIVWVPGRPKDIRVRGFDHAELIARTVAAVTGLRLVGCLRRTGYRPDQTSLSGVDRRANLEGAFSATAGPDRVVLIDDLVTTGATATACARALLEAGTTRVEVGAPCRA
jgi:ComF family protein